LSNFARFEEMADGPTARDSGQYSSLLGYEIDGKRPLFPLITADRFLWIG